MCGRYALFTAPHKLKDLFGTENLPNFPPRYNAAPTQDMPVIIRHRMGMARWGFLPPWANENDLSIGAKMINARSETVGEKPSFRDSWAKGRRCLVPANGFYEWLRCKNGEKQPFYIHHKDGNIVAFAGLWSKIHDTVTFTILTKQADKTLTGIHHRMPVIFGPEQAGQWFTSSTDAAARMIEQANAQDMDYYEVGKKVGNVANDSETLIHKIRLSS